MVWASEVGPKRIEWLWYPRIPLGAILRDVISQLGDGNHLFSLEEDLHKLELWVQEYRPALVVIDPIQAHIGRKTDIHRANETRGLLGPLALLAVGYRFAAVIVRHITTAGGAKALYRPNPKVVSPRTPRKCGAWRGKP